MQAALLSEPHCKVPTVLIVIMVIKPAKRVHHVSTLIVSSILTLTFSPAIASLKALLA